MQAGVTNIGITNAVQERGFFYAPDPSSQLACMIGGNVNMNSGGAHCLKYGVTANNLLGLKVVTIDGQILDIGGTHLDAAGYDWLGLLTGSEGQLVVIASQQSIANSIASVREVVSRVIFDIMYRPTDRPKEISI